MAEQLLSTDPKAGQLLSEDPSAGTPAAAAPAGTWEDRGIGGKVWHPASGGSERTRVDNSLLGMPPELAVLAPIGIARAIAGAGVGMAGRAVAGAKAVVEQAAPAVKYEATKHALEAMGIPSPLAVAAAIAVSGYKKGAPVKAAPAARAPRSAPAASTAAPTSAAPVAAPVAEAAPALAAARAPIPMPARPTLVPKPSTAAALPDQKALNEAALAARRATYSASQQAAPVAQAAAAAPAAADRIALTAAETKEFLRLLKRGLKGPEAMAAVKQARELAARLGGATPAEVAKAVAHREGTGKW